MEILFLAGRVMYVTVFLAWGLAFHWFGDYPRTLRQARAQGAPAPQAFVPILGLTAIAGAALVGLGALADLGAILIAAFLIAVTPFMHAFWRERGREARQRQMAQFMKNLALLGGAIVIFYVYNQLQGDAGLSLTEPLFGRG